MQKKAEIGQEAHRQIEKELKDAFGAKTEVKIELPNQSVRKDAIMPDGTPVIIKPNTQSGIKSANKREKLLNENGYKKTITLYYDPQNPAFQKSSPTYIGPNKK
ncbi:MAG: hypothetical protein IJ159_00635 [Prevotella sp.]|nr:hypothetical protein [Prevotella sp.]